MPPLFRAKVCFSTGQRLTTYPKVNHDLRYFVSRDEQSNGVLPVRGYWPSENLHVSFQTTNKLLSLFDERKHPGFLVTIQSHHGSSTRFTRQKNGNFRTDSTRAPGISLVGNMRTLLICVLPMLSFSGAKVYQLGISVLYLPAPICVRMN